MGYPKMNSGGLSGSRAAGLSYAVAAPAASAIGTALGVNPTALAALSRAFPWLAAALAAKALYDSYRATNRTAIGGILCGSLTGGTILRGAGALVCGNAATHGQIKGVLIQDLGATVRYAWTTAVPYSGPFPQTFGYQQTGSAQFSVPKGANAPITYGAQQATALPGTFRFSPEPWFDPTGPDIAKPSRLPLPLPWPVIPYKPLPMTDPHPDPLPPPRPLPRPPRPRPIPQPEPVTPDQPGPIPRPTPQPQPSPVPGPSPSPTPTPTPTPSPDADPQPWWDYYPEPSPALWQYTSNRSSHQERTSPATDRRSRYRTDTGVTMEIKGPSEYRLKPPGPNVREIKVRFGAAIGLMWAAINAITEARDFIKSMHKALPKRFRTRTKAYKGQHWNKHAPKTAPSVQKMFQEVYSGIRNMRDDELAKFTNDAIDNLITDQIKDYVFGKMGQAVGQGSRKQGRPIGYGAGPAL